MKSYRCLHRALGSDTASCRCPVFEPSYESNDCHSEAGDAPCGLCEHPRAWHVRPVNLNSDQLALFKARGVEPFERCKAIRAGETTGCPCPCLVRDGARPSLCALCGCKVGWHRPTHGGTDASPLPTPRASPIPDRHRRNSGSTTGLVRAGGFRAPSISTTSFTESPYANDGPREEFVTSIDDEVSETHATEFTRHNGNSLFSGGHGVSTVGTSIQHEALRARSPMPPMPKLQHPELAGFRASPSSSERESAKGGSSSGQSSVRRTRQWIDLHPNGRPSPGGLLEPPSPIKDHPYSQNGAPPTITPSQAVSGSARQIKAASGSEVFHSSKMKIQATVSPQPSRHTFRPGDSVSIDIALGLKVSLSKYESLTVSLIGELSVIGKKDWGVGTGSGSDAHRFLEVSYSLMSSNLNPETRRWDKTFHLPPTANCACDKHPPGLPPAEVGDGFAIAYRIAVVGKRKERLALNDKITIPLDFQTSPVSRFAELSIDGSTNGSSRDLSRWTVLQSSTATTRIAGLAGAGITSSQLDANVEAAQDRGTASLSILYRVTCGFAEDVHPSDRLVSDLASSSDLRLALSGGRQIASSGGRNAAKSSAPSSLRYSVKERGVGAYLIFSDRRALLRFEGVINVSLRDLQAARAAKSTISVLFQLKWRGLSQPLQLAGALKEGMLPRCPLHWLQTTSVPGPALVQPVAGPSKTPFSPSNALVAPDASKMPDRPPPPRPARTPTTLDSDFDSDLESVIDQNISHLQTVENLRRRGYHSEV